MEAAALASTTPPAGLLELGRKRGVDLASEPGMLGDLAALQLTQDLWRDSPLEQAHAGRTRGRGISEADADMFRCTVAAYRVVRLHVRPPELDWTGLAAALSDPRRQLPGGHDVGDLLGSSFQALGAHVDDAVRVYRGVDTERFLLAAGVTACCTCVNWYGTPWWPLVVDRLRREAADSKSPGSRRCAKWSVVGPTDEEGLSTVLEGLLTRPEDLPVTTLAWCLGMGVGGFGGAARDRWVARR